MVSFLHVSPPNSSIHLYLPIHATCPAHLIILDFITRKILGEEYKSLSSSLRSFLQSRVTSSVLCQNILLSILFSYTLSLRSSLNLSDQVSHPYKTTGKTIVLYILIFKLLDRKLEEISVLRLLLFVQSLRTKKVAINFCCILYLVLKVSAFRVLVQKLCITQT